MRVTRDIEAAADAIRAGLLVGLPTETVYGVAADASNPAAIARLFAAKGRPDDRPLPLLIPAAADLHTWASEPPEAAMRLAEALWPGPLTLVLPRSAAVSALITGGRDTVGLRVADHPLALALLRAVGRPLATPSANQHGQISATSPSQVVDQIGASLELILDGGRSALGLESTVVSVGDDGVQVLRRGAVPASVLRDAVGPGVRVTETPGGATTRFRLQTKVELVAPADCAARQRELEDAGRAVAVVRESTAGACGLYARLGEADAAGYDVILVDPGDNPVARAVLEHRLR